MELIEKAKKIELLSSKLGLIIPVPYLHIEHRDKNGVLYPNGDYYNVARSWTRNAYNHLISRISGYYARDASPNWGTGFINYKDTGDTIQSNNAQAFTYNDDSDGQQSIEGPDAYHGYWSTAGLATVGIGVGTGVGVESFEDNAITLIAHGIGSGQLSYAIIAVAESDAGLVHKASWSRVITHGGNGQPNVVVAEVDMVMVLNLAGGARYYFMMLRDLLASVVDMAYLDTLTVTYEITLTYPS
jgi:hypothetical protein